MKHYERNTSGNSTFVKRDHNIILIEQSSNILFNYRDSLDTYLQHYCSNLYCRFTDKFLYRKARKL